MGKPEQPGTSKQQDLPKYMCLDGNTQYELAQSIDAAMASAEREVKADQEQEALYLWYEQVLDGIHENFLLQKSVKNIHDNGALVANIIELIPLCWTYFQASGQTLETAEIRAPATDESLKLGFQVLITGLLEHSYMNALDILHARNLWRFDIQRNMQHSLKQIQGGVQGFIRGL